MEAFLAHYSIPKSENVKFISEKNLFTFGKHKGKSFGEVFEFDKAYVVWILKTNAEQRKYFTKSYNYF